MNGLYEVLDERREGQVMTARRLWSKADTAMESPDLRRRLEVGLARAALISAQGSIHFSAAVLTVVFNVAV